MKLDTIKQIYTHFAKSYDVELKKDMKYTAYLKLPRLVIDALDGKPAKVLDLGCGTGLSSLLFFEKGYEVIGIDGTRAMINRARKLPYRKLIQQNLETELRVKDHAFDAVVMIGVMEYVNNPLALFKQVRRKLVEGGVFGLTVPNKSRWYTDSKLKSYYKKEIEPAILKAGFRIEKSEKILGLEDAGNQVGYWIFLLRER